MVCDKCGTKVTKNDKFCPKCGAETRQPSKRMLKPILLCGLILLLFTLCIVLKYMAIIPISIIIILGLAIIINRKILRLRKSKKNDVQVEEQKFSDREMEKLSEYFVNRDEKYVSSLGNGYIMNFLLNKGLKRGFAVISDKRVYFRGSCFSGQGKTLKKTDEERTVDIRDITGSGFVYQRYIGILTALFTACIVLLGSVAGAGVGAVYSWRETYCMQEEEKNAGKKLEEAKNADEKLAELDEELSSLQEKEAELSAMREQDIQKQSDEKQKQLDEQMKNHELLLNSDVSTAFKEYLSECVNLFENSDTYYCIQILEEAAKSNQQIADFIGLEPPYCHDPNIDGINIYDIFYIDVLEEYSSPNLCFTNIAYDVYGYDYKVYNLANDCYFACLQYDMPYNENSIYELIMEEVIYGNTSYEYIYATGECYGKLLSSYEARYEHDWYAYGIDECKDEADQLFIKFINKFIPEATLDNIHSDKYCVTGHGYFTLLDLEAAYYSNNSVILNDESVYDSELQQIQIDIEQVKDEISEVREVKDKLEYLEREYNEYKGESFGYFMLTTLASAGAAALVTFLISCIGIFFDYLSKRKTLFEIQYAGGRIAFDVSYYAKAEIDDFQKQLRRAKDLSQETATVRTVAPETPTQASTQSSVPDDLRKYADLLKEGLISQEEYDSIKKKILGL